MRILTVVFFLLLFCGGPARLYGQDLSGTWQGNYVSDGFIAQPLKVIMELYRIDDTTYNGATHLFYKKGKFEHYKINAKYDPQTQQLSASEDSLLDYKPIFGMSRSAGTYRLSLDTTNAIHRIAGEWKTKRRFFFRKWSVGAWFDKQPEPVIKKLQDNSTQTATLVKDTALNRRTELQSLVNIYKSETDTVRLDIFDNATIDNDSVSVYIDDSLAISKQRISDQSIRIALPVNQLKLISKIKLIAESLGNIPPCTALMIVTAGRKRYEVNLSSNFAKNAVLELVLSD